MTGNVTGTTWFLHVPLMGQWITSRWPHRSNTEWNTGYTSGCTIGCWMGINGALELHDDWMVNSWMFYASTDFYRLLPTSTSLPSAAPRLWGSRHARWPVQTRGRSPRRMNVCRHRRHRWHGLLRWQLWNLLGLADVGWITMSYRVPRKDVISVISYSSSA